MTYVGGIMVMPTLALTVFDKSPPGRLKSFVLIGTFPMFLAGAGICALGEKLSNTPKGS